MVGYPNALGGTSHTAQALKENLLEARAKKIADLVNLLLKLNISATLPVMMLEWYASLAWKLMERRRQRARAPGIECPARRVDDDYKSGIQEPMAQRAVVTWIICLKITQETQIIAV